MREQKVWKDWKKVFTGAAVLAVTLAAALGATGCGNESVSKGASGEASKESSSESSSGELTTLKFGVMTGNIDHQVITVGIEKGFFEENGIDLQYSEYAAGINTVDALTTDQIDVGIAADFAILNRIGNTENSDLKIVANYANIAAQKLYVDPEKISDIKDLKGKKLLNLQGTIWEYWDALTIQKAGLTKEDVELVNVDSQPSAVTVASQGDADAYWASGDTAAKLAGFGWKPVLELSDLDATTTMFFIARENYAKENAETLKKFYAGFQKTVDYIEANVDETASIISDKLGLTEENVKAIFASYDLGVQFKKNIYEYLDGVNQWLKENAYYKNAFNTGDIIDVTAVKEAYPDKVEIE